MRFSLLHAPLLYVLLSNTASAAPLQERAPAGEVWVGIFLRMFAGNPTFPPGIGGIGASVGNSIKETIVQGVVSSGVNALLSNGKLPAPTVQQTLIARLNDDNWNDIFWDRGNTNKVATLPLVYDGEPNLLEKNVDDNLKRAQELGVLKFTVPNYKEKVTMVRQPGDKLNYDVFSDATDKPIGDCHFDNKAVKSIATQVFLATFCNRELLCRIDMRKYYE